MNGPIDYTLTPLDLDDEAQADRRRGYLTATHRAFHEGRPTEEWSERWLEWVRADRGRFTGVWLPEDRFGASDVPVATYGTFEGTLNAGRDVVPLWMITDVTVSPAHRRRGLLRQMMGADLDRAAAAGVPIAALTASEGGIYDRYGFGPAVWTQTVEVAIDRRFALRHEPVGVRVEIVRAEDLGSIPEDDFDRWHREHRGSVSRLGFYRAILRGEIGEDSLEKDPKLLTAVAVDEDDRPLGHVAWRHEGKQNGRDTLRVVDLIATTSQAHLALWQFIAGIDLADVALAKLTFEDPLRWAVTDPRSVRVTGQSDVLWLRILDVPTALVARPWSGSGTVTLTVRDSLGHADGTWTVHVTDGVAEVTEGGEGGVAMDVATLSTLFLGGAEVGPLAAAGRVTGSDGDLATWTRLSAVDPRPETRSFF